MEYPHFLSTQPRGIDLYDGKSQEKLAKDIERHILQIDQTTPDDFQPIIPRIIGLEGAWGTGKSNVIAGVQEYLKDNYIFYTYDAWAYQEDLQRRSFLEGLTTELITCHKESIKETTTIQYVQSINEQKSEIIQRECSWTQRLEYLTARKSQTKCYSNPSFNNSTKWFILFLLISGIYPAVINACKMSTWACWWPFAFCFCGLLLLWLMFFGLIIKFDKNKLKEMWHFYQTSNNSETTTFAISQNEPTEKEFRTWLQDINNSLIDKRLVVVFDNMDRLPAEKVKSLWSTIYTFFAGVGYNKIWSIIPFDNDHLARAYGRNENSEVTDPKEYETSIKDALSLCGDFKAKTFPVVYHVPDAVITDYRFVFITLLNNAFGETISEDQKDAISRIFRAKHPMPNVRNIIGYINELVLLSQRWLETINIETMAIFIIMRDELKQNPDYLLSNRYLGQYVNMYDDTPNRKTEMASLYYGVEENVASQLPMRRFLQDILTISNMNEINEQQLLEYSTQNYNFYEILDEQFRDLDFSGYHSNAVQILMMLNQEAKYINKGWKVVADKFISSKDLAATSDDEYVLHIIEHAPTSAAQHVLTEYLCRLECNIKNLRGDTLANTLNKIQDIVDQRKLDFKCPSIQLEPDQFFNYIHIIKEKYTIFSITCDKNAFEIFLINQIENNIDVSAELSILKNEKAYDINIVREKIKNLICVNESKIDFCDFLFKQLRASAVAPISFTKTDIQHLSVAYSNILNTNSKLFALRDLYIILGLHGQGILPIAINQLEGIEKTLWKYCNTEELINMVISTQNNVIVSLLQYCITKTVVEDASALPMGMLAKLPKIHQITNIEMASIYKYVEAYKYTLTEDDKELNLKEALGSIEWLKVIVESESSLSQSIIHLFKNQIDVLNATDICTSDGQLKSKEFWVDAINILFEHGEYVKKLPNILKTIAGKLIESIARGSTIQPEYEKLVEHLLKMANYSDVSSNIHNAIEILKSRDTDISLSYQKLNRWIAQTNIKDNSDTNSFLNKVINRIKETKEFHGCVCAYPEFYRSMFDNHIDSDSDLRMYFMTIKEKKIDVEEDFLNFIQSLTCLEESAQETVNEELEQ